MITEDYVSFETAKLLKEKGFDEPCYAYWHEDENRLIISQSMHAIQNITNPCFFGPAVPTLQMAMKWLREVHSLSVEVQFFLNEENGISSWNYDIIDIITYCNKARYAMCVNFETYEQACEAAIKYCLENLI